MLVRKLTLNAFESWTIYLTLQERSTNELLNELLLSTVHYYENYSYTPNSNHIVKFRVHQVVS